MSATEIKEVVKDLNWLIEPVGISTDNIKNENIVLTEIDESKDIFNNYESKLMGGLSLLMANCDFKNVRGFNKSMINELIDKIDSVITNQVNEVIHNNDFKEIESSWLGIQDLVKNTDFKANIKIDLIDVNKDELAIDFECNSVDVSGSEFFKKVYFHEYDQFGGNPYAGLIGLYEFENTPEDMDFLSTIGKIGQVSHAPFISAINPSFFGCKTAKDIEDIKDIDGLMTQPKYRRWNDLRDTPEAAYLGLTFPKYLIREPWDPDVNPAGKNLKNFKEHIDVLDDGQYTWTNSAILFARNMTRSFKKTGWCQYIRGPKGGGMLENLPNFEFNVRGKKEIKAPVECILPDNKELSLANAGLIPLVFEKNTTNACFFSAQSVKISKEFEDPKDTEDSQLVCNLSYTMSVARIAHYIKEIARLNIGSTADATYLNQLLNDWIEKYVTVINNPNADTISYYPFKYANINVEKIEGKLGWYKCDFKVLPHLQFEGMDVAMSMTTRLEG